MLASTFWLFALFANAQDQVAFNYSNLDHWIMLVEATKFHNVKNAMLEIDFTLESEKSSALLDTLIFTDSDQEKFAFIYENKKLKKLGGSVFISNESFMQTYLGDKGYTVISKEKIRQENQEKEITTWGKSESPYKFIFLKNDSLHSILQIEIDRSTFSGTNIPNLGEMPPVQVFFDRIRGKSFKVDDSVLENISQKMTNNSFILIEKDNSSGNIFRTEIKGIDWENFMRINIFLTYDPNYIQCIFYFENNLNEIIFVNNVETDNRNNRFYFITYIYAKDEKELKTVIKDWEKSRELKEH